MAEFVKLEKLGNVADALRQLPKELVSTKGGPVRESLAAAARLIRDEARQRAPVRSGNLRKQIFMYRDRAPANGANEHYIISVRTGRRSKKLSKMYRNGQINSVVRRLKGNDAWYWRWVEFGTTKMSAQPYMRPAFEAKKQEAVLEAERVLLAGVAKAEAAAKAKAGA